MQALIAFFIGLIVILVLIWAVRALMAAFGIGDPIATVVYVLLVLIFLLWLVSYLGIVPLGHVR
jgi:hypothetical protein